MEGQTKILWDFMEAAYKEGVLDEFLLLSKAVTDKKYENQALVFSELEDSITEMDDFSTVDDKIEQAYRIMPQLTDKDALEGIRILLAVISPLVEKITAASGRDMEKVADKGKDALNDLRKVGKALAAFISIGSNSLVAASGSNRARQYGNDLGKALNKTAALVNDVHAADPEAISNFMSGIFEKVESEKMNKMLDILADGFLDQRPPLLRWSFSLMVKRAKKYLLGK